MPANRLNEKAQPLRRLLDFPSDLTLDLPKVTLIGNIQLIVENHRGLSKFTPTKIIIKTRLGPLVLNGQSLVVSRIRADELVIEGKIENIYLSSSNL